MKIISYLTFSGNCREAMTFYKNCLGGKLTFQTVGSSPLSEDLPSRAKKVIVHASLTKGDLVLMGTDLPHDEQLKKGNTVSLLLNCRSAQETRSYYKKLGEGGNETYPPISNDNGILMGELIDRYGNRWVVTSEAPS